MFKTIFFHSIISGILASAAGIIYDRIYFFATEVDFSKVLNTGSIIGLNIMVCIAAGIIFFSGVMIPISISLPLKIQMPELFPGLAVPMVFFPVMAWYTIRPLYKYA